MVNEFHDFDEGPQLLDLYFGGNRPSLLANALIVGLFYVGSLLLALAFLQPRRSRLRILERPPPASSSWPSAATAAAAAPGGGETGDGRGRTREGGWREERDGGGEELKEGGDGYGEVALKKVPGDPDLLQASNGDGPLYFLEEGGRVRCVVRRHGRGGGKGCLPACACGCWVRVEATLVVIRLLLWAWMVLFFFSVAAAVAVCSARSPTAVESRPCPLARYFECQKSCPHVLSASTCVWWQYFHTRRRVRASVSSHPLAGGVPVPAFQSILQRQTAPGGKMKSINRRVYELVNPPPPLPLDPPPPLHQASFLSSSRMF